MDKVMFKQVNPTFSDPPDGGWGWIVVVASFIIHIISDGMLYSFGILYIEFLQYFKGGKGETAWVGSMVPGITFIVEVEAKFDQITDTT
ncbi:hypothetical protein CHS0354_013202, partial [Potamilus streckersoni]